jgi:hypothetical protein
MQRALLIGLTLAVPLVVAASVLPANAAKSPAMESCSAEWKKMKDAGQIPAGQTWPKYWSKCSKDYAAAHPEAGTAAAPDNAAPAPSATTKKSASTKAAMAEESDSAGSGKQKKDCDAKWGSYKTRTGAHGWHDYFQFMAKCM